MAQQDANKRRAEEAAKVWGARKAEMVWLYETQQYSQEAIAGYYGVTLRTIQNAFVRLGIKPRARANYGKRNGRYKDGSESTLYRQMIEKDKCSKCEATDRLVIHHRNGNHQDNHLENLQVLCESCHNSHSKRLWWAARKEAGLSFPIRRSESGTFTGTAEDA